MKLIDFSITRKQYVIKMTLYVLSVFIFSLIYSTCEDNEFAGWVNSTSNDLLKEDRYLSIFFSKVTKGKKFMDLNTFLKLPIYKDNKKWFILNKKNNKTDSNISKKNKYNLFNTYKSSDGYISEANFLGISISINNIKKYKIPYDVTFPSSFNAPDGSAVHDYFDRLYFSFVTQALLGYGDIFPISKRTRIISLSQSVLSIFILYL